MCSERIPCAWNRLPCLRKIFSFKPWLNWSLIESTCRTAFGLTLNSGATQVKPDLTVIQNCVVKGFCVLGIVCRACKEFFLKPWLNWFWLFWASKSILFKFRPLCTTHRLWLFWDGSKRHQASHTRPASSRVGTTLGPLLTLAYVGGEVGIGEVGGVTSDSGWSSRGNSAFNTSAICPCRTPSSSKSFGYPSASRPRAHRRCRSHLQKALCRTSFVAETDAGLKTQWPLGQKLQLRRRTRPRRWYDIRVSRTLSTIITHDVTLSEIAQR